MSRYRSLVIGTAAALKSSRASELYAFLEQHEITFQSASDPAAKLAASWDLIFFLSLDAKPARPLEQWVEKVKGKKIEGRFVVLYQSEIAATWRTVLDPEIEIGEDHDLSESLAYLFEETQSAQSSESGELSMVVDDDALFASSGLAATSNTSTSVEQVTDIWNGAEGAEADAFLSNADSANSFDSEDVSLLMSDAGDAPSSSEAVDLGDIFSNLDSADSSSEEIFHPDANISEPLAGRETFNSEIDVDSIFSEELNRATQVGSTIGSRVAEISLKDEAPEGFAESDDFASQPLMGAGPSLSNSSDLSTLQKYAALKEREAREKEATIQVLKGQLAKVDTKLSRSDAERRRLTLENDEAKNQIGTLEENLSQKQFHIQKMEGHHQEEQRGLSLRLDNALFQASKSQNKLEEFRERVRTDFMKIRAQERELFNKLELQKRDAEALLASKDEQLLTQKREIDRLQYEVETLRERMVEETEKAEERSSRLQRAVQSLKLANDMLSGLSEEVLPAAGDNFESRDDDEDAA